MQPFNALALSYFDGLISLRRGHQQQESPYFHATTQDCAQSNKESVKKGAESRTSTRLGDAKSFLAGIARPHANSLHWKRGSRDHVGGKTDW